MGATLQSSDLENYTGCYNLLSSEILNVLRIFEEFRLKPSWLHLCYNRIRSVMTPMIFFLKRCDRWIHGWSSKKFIHHDAA